MSNLFKKVLVYSFISLLFGGVITYSIKRINKLKAETERLTENLKNSNFDIEISETKNKELVYSVKSLTVKANELKQINSKLYSEIDNLNLKVKDLQSLTEIKYDLIAKIDTLHTIPNLDLSNNKFKFAYKDDNTTINGEIIVPERYAFDVITENVSGSIKQDMLINLEKTNPGITEIIIDPKSPNLPYITDLHYKMSDSLMIANEFLYKRRWLFWKKVIGVKTHVKSSNPNFKVDVVQTYQVNN